MAEKRRINPGPAWTNYPPGSGPSVTVSVSLHVGTVQAVRKRVGKRGFSAHVEAALRRRIAHDNLGELIDEYTRVHGEFTAEEMAAAEAHLYGTGDEDIRRAR